MEKIVQTGKRETDREILEAIADLAHSPEEAERIWAEPSEEEMIAVWERVTKNGLYPAHFFEWGAAGTKWAQGVLR